MPFDGDKREYQAQYNLRISADENKLLAIVRDDLRSGAIKPTLFNMTVASTERACGTAMCIGGWVAAYAGVDPDKYVLNVNNKIWELYYPRGAGEWCWQDIGPEEAAQAIDNYLDCGRPDWDKVMASD